MAENWPGWRGANGDGTSGEKKLPTSWSNTENVAWKVPIAGEGHSSPIIWEDRIFLTTSLTEKNEAQLEELNARLSRMSEVLEEVTPQIEALR